MSKYNHIGGDFSKSVQVNLLPSLSPLRGTYHINIVYTTCDNSTTMINNCAFITDYRNLDIVIGRDVYDLHVTVYSHYLFGGYSSNMAQYEYHIRTDDLILLNIASKLLPLK